MVHLASPLMICGEGTLPRGNSFALKPMKNRASDRLRGMVGYGLRAPRRRYRSLGERVGDPEDARMHAHYVARAVCCSSF
jgi:hypothetical protein